MKTRWPFGWQQRLLLLPVLALMGFFVAVEPGQADDPPKPPRSKAEQIAELEKQIKELMAKLDALKNAPAEPKSSSVPGSLPIEWTKSLTWRSIGPATMGGRITDIAVFPGDPSCYYIAHGVGWSTEDRQQRHHLRASIRQGSDRLHRRGGGRPIQPRHCLGGHG
jgi:hypothetical protein